MSSSVARSPAALPIAGAVVALVLFVGLGALVSHAPPGAIDAWAYPLFFGQATALAAAITTAGTFPYYAVLCAVALMVGFVRREWLPRTAVAVATLVIAWQTSDVFKALFHRLRPPQWHVFHETSFSYASGHAVLVTAFWGVWALYALQSVSRPLARAVVVGAIVLWILTIGWSRLALGAHYLSDVVGGYLLGVGFVFLAALAARSLRRDGTRRSPAG